MYYLEGAAQNAEVWHHGYSYLTYDANTSAYYLENIDMLKENIQYDTLRKIQPNLYCGKTCSVIIKKNKLFIKHKDWPLKQKLRMADDEQINRKNFWKEYILKRQNGNLNLIN